MGARERESGGVKVAADVGSQALEDRRGGVEREGDESGEGFGDLQGEEESESVEWFVDRWERENLGELPEDLQGEVLGEIFLVLEQDLEIFFDLEEALGETSVDLEVDLRGDSGDLELEGLGEVLLDRVEREEVDLRGRKGGGSSAGSITGAEGSIGGAGGLARNMCAGEQ